jgi:hypothetical protein
VAELGVGGGDTPVAAAIASDATVARLNNLIDSGSAIHRLMMDVALVEGDKSANSSLWGLVLGRV